MVMLWHGQPFVPPSLLPAYKYLLRFDGVDVFFALSGFLIGGILIRTLETKPASLSTLGDFWARRWIRTVPPYYLALGIAIILETRQPGVFAGEYKRYFLFLQNLNWVHPLRYPEGWSLAVEEWFYLLSAPAIFLLVAAKLKPQVAVAVAAVGVILAMTLHRYYHFLHLPPHTLEEWDVQLRKIVLMRLDNLMYGVLAAYWTYYYKQSWHRYKEAKFIIGLLWLCLQPIPTEPADYTLFGCVFYFACTPLATILMLPLLSSWESSNGAVGKAITHVSLISYSMYLLHFTILKNRIIEPLIHSLAITERYRNLLGMSLFWGLTLLCATLMYKYFEVPVMALRSRLSSARSAHAKARVP